MPDVWLHARPRRPRAALVAGLTWLLSSGALATATTPRGVPQAAAPTTTAAAPTSEATLPALTCEEQEQFLKEAEIVASAPIGKGITKPWRLTLRKGPRTHTAAFQSIDRAKDDVSFRGGRRERLFKDFYGYNIAAYRLARLLGYDDLVPVSIRRRWKGQDGALTWWIEKKWDEDERLKAGVSPPNQLAWERQVYLARAFTALVQDTDRNLGNQLVTADFHLWMIDFTRAFRYGSTLEGTATLRKVDRRFYERLQSLSDEAIKAEIESWVDGPAVKALLARRRAMVAHFAAIIAERGEAIVLLD
jgi:hypothetical protein